MLTRKQEAKADVRPKKMQKDKKKRLENKVRSSDDNNKEKKVVKTQIQP